jgi:predicted AlkP superfamily phosphohydrolase/phosphomutase
MKVVVVGLDGATFDLINPWAEAGYLPNLRRLMVEGASGPVYSTIPPMTAPAWTSFMTGKNPGKHGLYDWIFRHKESYDVSPVTARHCHEPTLWSLLSESGQRVCVINVPMTYPPTAVDGLMISGMPAPSTNVTITYPESLLNELEQKLGEYLLYPDPGQAYSDSGVDAFLERLYRTTNCRFRVVASLRAREDWAFLMVVLNGTDTVQHSMWKFMSPEHPLHDPRRADKYGNAILKYFQYVDGSLGEIMASLDSDTVLMVMSDHGFGPFHKFIHLNNWLRQEGLLEIKRDPKARFKSTLFKLGFTPMNIYDWLMRFGLGALKREVVRGQGQGLLRAFFLSFDDVDWSRTIAYSLGNVGQIRLNVRGREPEGVVEPGVQYERVRSNIINRLWKLRDQETGEQVVQEVYRREEIYWGAKVDEAADIVFVPTRMEYFGFGEYEFGSHKLIERMKRGISGTHRFNGILLLWGEPIRAGAKLASAQLYDLAPTILHLMGEPVPSDMDGQVLTEVLKPEYAELQHLEEAKEDPTLGETSQRSPTAPTNSLSSEDEELIIKRLRGLGYVG